VNDSAYSEQLAYQRVWLSGLLPYEQGSAVFRTIGERWIPASSLWRQTQQHGERLQAHVEHQQAQVSVERVVLPAVRYDHDQRKGVSLDGGMVNLRGEGWREMKVGTVFDLEMRLERDPHTQQLGTMAHGVNLHYTATLAGIAAFTPALWALAVTHHVPTAKERVVVGDGALWVWNVAEEVCPDARQIVDWFHAVQHVAEAALALFPSDDQQTLRTRWLTTHTNHLYMGRLHIIIQALHTAHRADLATYFERHQRRMQYLECREEGFPIGSGTVESGVKQFKHRLTGTGMRWNPRNATLMLLIRAAVLGDDFAALWKDAA
jgi:Transposase